MKSLSFWISLSIVACLTSLLAAEDVPFAFRDVTKESGLLPAVAEIMAHGAGWGDADGDGWADLYVGTFHYKDTQPNLFFRNREGRFERDPQTALGISARATGVLFADLDNDGDLDLYVASMPSAADSRLAERMGHAFAGCSLFRNDGGGKFENVSADNGACPTAFGGRSATVLDFDGDGLLDLLVGEDPIPNYNGSKTKSSRLFRNLGGLRFEDVSREVGLPADVPGLGLAAADVNLDGRPDFLLASTLGNRLFLNDGRGKFRESPGAAAIFAWPTAKGDDMVCGVAIGDVNGDGLPDVVLGQHYSQPWITPVANRLYLNRGVTNGVPTFEDVTERVGLPPLPMKAPHVEIQDFDNDGRPDLYASVVKFADGRPHPLIFRNLPGRDGLPRFVDSALDKNDFPNDGDRAVKRSGPFFEKMIAEKRILYTAPGPSCDYDRDGRLDLFLGNWWAESPSLLLKNETQGGHWIDVRAQPPKGVNRMGIGSRVVLYEAGGLGKPEARLGVREIATGFGYASSQEAIAHFGLGERAECDVEVILPWDKGRLTMQNVKANRRVTVGE